MGATADELRPAWDLPGSVAAGEPVCLRVPPLLCAEGQFLFGGWAMALAVQLAQRWSGQAVRSLSCEFVLPIRAEDELEVRLNPVRVGSRVTHCAVSVARGDELAFAAHLVVGEPPTSADRPRSPAPPAPEPASCPGRTYRYHGAGTAIDTLDVRLAVPEPTPEDDRGGRVLLWTRVRCAVEPAAALAVLSDHVPYLISRSFARVRHATSVSSTVRLTGVPVDEWVLLEAELVAVDGLFAVGRVRQWGRDGALVAVADQTTYLRID